MVLCAENYYSSFGSACVSPGSRGHFDPAEAGESKEGLSKDLQGIGMKVKDNSGVKSVLAPEFLYKAEWKRS